MNWQEDARPPEAVRKARQLASRIARYRAAGWTPDEVMHLWKRSGLVVQLDSFPRIETRRTTCAL